MKKMLNYKLLIAIICCSLTLTSCFKRGTDDPFLSVHSRDGRLTQNWIMVSMTGTSVNTLTYVQDGISSDSIVNTEFTYDGTNLYKTVKGVTESSNYIMRLQIKDDGEVFSSETYSNVATPGTVIATNSKTSFWYWGNDDKNKTAVYLDLTGILGDYPVYDIPRLAWNDMTLTVSYSDNYTVQNDSIAGESTPSVGSLNVNFEIKFDVELL